MPLLDSPPDAVARVYAQSLFELASESGGRDTAEQMLGELEDIAELARANPDFSEMLASRVVATGKRDAALTRIFEGKVSPTTLRFLRLLNSKDRLGHLLPILSAFDRVVQESYGRVEVDVFTAAPISPDELRSIRERLSSALGKDVIAHPYTDHAMIGGLKLRIGDQLIDGSVQTQLRNMRDRLTRQGGSTLRSRASDILGS
jgi:F-type H+-transporting ATPase subunit delta